ncbi:hypothetical protein HY449_03265 [Candidatus Pacearchaeota archaeon]|nr:hypothetical protein [Candidatus Pacearchaeota archaeon]
MKKRGRRVYFSGESPLKKNRGQLTIFIIIAIAIVSAAVLFFALRENIFNAIIVPKDLQPVYNTFLSCIQDSASVGINVLGSQGGYIQLPEFSPGSSHTPFSSQLNFLGNPIPYWHYVSGNNIERTQIPSKTIMQNQLGEFLDSRIRGCRFDEYYDEGFQIFVGEPKTSVTIMDDSVEFSVDAEMSISREDETALVKNHKVTIDSEIGNLYDSAVKIYEYEQDNLFLENYGVDVLRLYAPVDGVELKCSPLVWNANDVFEKLKEAIESNTLAIKTKSGLLSANAGDKYFFPGISVPHDVRFLNSRNWSSAFEVSPSEGAILLSTPVGTQPGLGALGFCYVPYHFVYSMKYPVLVQISGKKETFQFPVAVVIQGNVPRKAMENSTAIQVDIPELCSQKNTLAEVSVFDENLNPINANVSYSCAGTECRIGETSSGKVSAMFPQCVNGFVIATADGFEETKQLYSVVENANVNIFMNQIYDKNVNLKIDGKDYEGQATITFASEEGNSRTVVYPERKTVKLSEGQYEVQVYVYRNSSLTIGAKTVEECVDVPQTGVGGFFGFNREKCFKIDFPAEVVSNALAGGGSQNYYVLESELKNSNIIEINVDGLPLPTSIDQLQQNYILLEDKGLKINFR